MHACTHTTKHTYLCILYVCVFDYACGIFVCHSPAVAGKVLLPRKKEAAHNYKFHSEEHKGLIEKMCIYRELLGIYSTRPALCL